MVENRAEGGTLQNDDAVNTEKFEKKKKNENKLKAPKDQLSRRVLVAFYFIG